MHLGLDKRPAALAMIAGWASCNQIAPFVFTALAARNDVVNRHVQNFIAAVLTGVIISPQDFPLTQFNPNARPLDHPFQSNNRRTRVFFRYGMDETTAVEDESRFTGHHQPERSASIADIQRLKISI
jgi:hypothetical protein